MRSGDYEASDVFIAKVGRRRVHFLRVHDNTLGYRHKRHTGGGKSNDAIAPAQENSDSELVFEFQDLLAYARLRGMKCFRSG